MISKIESRLFASAAVWTVLGLASGLYYREFTRTRDFSGRTQLAVAHTHALTLGMLVLLLVLVLTRVFNLARDARMRYFLGFWNAGLALTFGMLVVKGSLQVLGSELAASKAIAGVSGLGHMILTGTLVLLFLILRRGLTQDAPASVERADSAAATVG